MKWLVAVVACARWGTGSISMNHQIKQLPGLRESIGFDQFAGQLTLPSNGQKMFYWLVESQSNPSEDPLVLWLNGGPGCSSLTGFFTELGPFIVQTDLSLRQNKYSWNRKTNMLFLESPSGVGFSQPRLNASEDYNDIYTAARTREFLTLFLDVYSSFRHRHFFVTGESYAGMYIPHLVHHLIQEPLLDLNLKGFAIGNPITDHWIDNRAFIDYYYTHAMISLEAYTDIQTTCNKTSLAEHAGIWSNHSSNDPCSSAIRKAIDSSDTAELNRYDIYGDVCLWNRSHPPILPLVSIRPNHRGMSGPCAATFTEAYLNLDDVQAALHVPPNTYHWKQCTDDITDKIYNRTMTALPLYPTILAQGLQVLIYSGDADSMVSFLGTQRWITEEGLNLTRAKKWRPWFTPDQQIGGYRQEYYGLNFSTVRGAAHMVPATRPLHGLYLFECFIFGQEACDAFSFPQDNLEYLSGLDVPYSATEDDQDVFIQPPALHQWQYLVWYLTLVSATFYSVRWINYVETKKRLKYVSLNADAKPVYTAT